MLVILSALLEIGGFTAAVAGNGGPLTWVGAGLALLGWAVAVAAYGRRPRP